MIRHWKKSLSFFDEYGKFGTMRILHLMEIDVESTNVHA